MAREDKKKAKRLAREDKREVKNQAREERMKERELKKEAEMKVLILHGPSMFAAKAKIYGVLYNQASSIAFDETSSYWSAPKCS